MGSPSPSFGLVAGHDSSPEVSIVVYQHARLRETVLAGVLEHRFREAGTSSVNGRTLMHPNRSWKVFFYISLLAVLAFLPGAARKDGDKEEGRPTRFGGLDLNNDGRITRDEWRGSDRSFSVHDRNRDGVILGNEAGDLLDIDRNDDGKISKNEWRWLDRDGNMRISLDEWDDDLNGFDALDESGDGTLSRGELMRVSEARRALFHVFDVDGNGLLSRREWKGDKHSFARLDTNGDRRLMREEFITRSHDLEKGFDELDRDQSGRLDSLEWRGDKKAFGDLDDNHDGQISLAEFVGVN